MVVVEMESLFSTPMPSFLEISSRIQSADQNELTEIAYEMINVTVHFATNFQQFKASTVKRIDRIERLILKNVTGHDTVRTEDMKQQVEFFENNRLRMESEPLIKVTDFLSVQQINTHEINGNADKFITLKETGKSRKNKLIIKQTVIPLKLFPSKNARTNLNLLMKTTQCYLHLIMLLVKEDRKKSQLNTKKNQNLTLLTTNIKGILMQI